MREHRYRSLLILAIVVVSAVQIYPTVGWTMLDPAERASRLEQWREEDVERMREGPGTFQKGVYSAKRWAQFDREMVINLGLDLLGGLHMVLGFDMTPEAEERGLTESDIQDIILRNVTNRINEYEAKEPLIQKLGTNQIQIQLPGEKDIQRAKNLIMQTAFLTFNMVSGPQETVQVLKVVDAHFNNDFVPFLDSPSSRGGQYEVSEEYFEHISSLAKQANEVPGLLPEGKMIAFSPPPTPWQEGGYLLYVMDAKEEMTGEDLKNAVARPDDQTPGNWLILFEFGTDGARDFGELTEANIGRQMGIVVDGHVVSAPNINERIYASGRITGNFSPEEAQDLAIALNSGSMPVPVREDYTAVVGPSLGQDSVERGVTSSILGLLIVMVFMVLYYRVAGIVADISLAINALLILGAFSYFNVTLTLPGIAGLILTIGMAVDANVLIFERIREEQSTGKSLAASVEKGFERAQSAIVDANVTTLIAAVVLTQFGTGPVQGFAIALCIGIVSSVFAALVITRAQLDFISENKLVEKLGMARLIPAGTTYKFLEKRHICAGISLVAIGIGMTYFAIRGGDNFGVDFKNGTNAIVALNAPQIVEAGELRDLLTSEGFDSPTVQEYQEADAEHPNSFVIRVGETGQEEGATNESVSTRIQRALLPLTMNPSSSDLGAEVELLRVETVGPAVGAQLQRDAINAIIFALIFIVLYLWFRFEWMFAFAAVVALVHDVLIVVGVISLVGREITIPMVAALLTIIGYSLNDTIVVFDRIREDIALNKARGLSFMENLNVSINRTLSRTILTSITTLFVVTVLYLFGGSAINDFAFALIVGIIVGTYSSVFVATPVVYVWQQWRDRRDPPSPGEGGKRAGRHAKPSAKSASA